MMIQLIIEITIILPVSIIARHSPHSPSLQCALRRIMIDHNHDYDLSIKKKKEKHDSNIKGLIGLIKKVKKGNEVLSGYPRL